MRRRVRVQENTKPELSRFGTKRSTIMGRGKSRRKQKSRSTGGDRKAKGRGEDSSRLQRRAAEAG